MTGLDAISGRITTGDLERAVEILSGLIADPPADPEVRERVRGQVLALQKRLERAQQVEARREAVESQWAAAFWSAVGLEPGDPGWRRVELEG